MAAPSPADLQARVQVCTNGGGGGGGGGMVARMSDREIEPDKQREVDKPRCHNRGAGACACACRDSVVYSHIHTHASGFGPSSWGPWFPHIYWGFCRLLQILQVHFCRHYRPRGRPRRRATSSRPPFFVGTTSVDAHVGVEIFGRTLESP
jgi:hypothetical protein